MGHALARRPLRVTRKLVLGEVAAMQTAQRQVLDEAVVVVPRLIEARTNAMDVGALDTGGETASVAMPSSCVMSVHLRRTP